MKSLISFLWILQSWTNAIGCNERMGGSVADFIAELERAGDLTRDQARFISARYPDYDESDRYQDPDPSQLVQEEASLQDDMIAYLVGEEAKGRLSRETKIYVSALLHLQDDFTRTSNERSIALPTPVPGDYEGNGIVGLLGRSQPYPISNSFGFDDSKYMGIWGYATGSREYALVCHSFGLYIVDITIPASSFCVQSIQMAGGRIWRDAETYTDETSGKTYAYVAAQAGGNLFVVDLSYLSGSAPHKVDGAKCPFVDRGYKNFGHTVTVRGDFLILNTAGSSSKGCQIFDLKPDPWNPTLFLNSYFGTKRDCHDSDLLVGVNVPGFNTPRDLLFSADGFAQRYRIVDITDIRAGKEPYLLGETEQPSTSITYAHSITISEDSKYLYAFDELNNQDIRIYEISDVFNMKLVRSFSYSNDDIANSVVHNGHVRGNYLLTAYYEAGLRVFDISDPINPIEVGKHDTYLDPGGTGEYPFSLNVTGSFNGAWNLYPHLPSRNIIINDISHGLFILRLQDESVPESPGCKDIVGWNTVFDCGVLETFGCSVESYLLGHVDGRSGQKACCSCGGGVK